MPSCDPLLRIVSAFAASQDFQEVDVSRHPRDRRRIQHNSAANRHHRRKLPDDEPVPRQKQRRFRQLEPRKRLLQARQRSASSRAARSPPRSPSCTNESAPVRDPSALAALKAGVAASRPPAASPRTSPEAPGSCLATSLRCSPPPDSTRSVDPRPLPPPFAHAPARRARALAARSGKLPAHPRAESSRPPAFPSPPCRIPSW